MKDLHSIGNNRFVVVRPTKAVDKLIPIDIYTNI